MTTRPFRFGVQLSSLPTADWPDHARQIEAMGFSTLFVPDHFSASAWDPTTLLGGVAAVTRSLRVGTLVYGVDYRHPIVYARQAATLQAMSGGRHEFGIGAGWMIDDYEWAGLRYDSPGTRIERLDEALTIIASMWSKKRTTFEGRHYRVTDAPMKIDLGGQPRPRILVGGGGRKLLSVAARHADIVGINPKIPEGRITAQTALDMTQASARRKVDWVREAAESANRDFDSIELSVLVFAVAMTDSPQSAFEMIAASTGMPADVVGESPLFLVGSKNQICDMLQARRDQTGISYVVVQGNDRAQIERFAQDVVQTLNGR